MGDSPYGHLEGLDLGSGQYTVEPWEAFLWADATHNDEDGFRRQSEAEAYGVDEQLVPPEYAMQVAYDAIAVDLEELGLDPDFENGVYHGGQEFHFQQPIVVGEPYTVSGTIGSIERKHGENGRFDVVSQRFESEDSTGEPVFETTGRAILMR